MRLDVLIDLKRDKITPQDLGRMLMYLNYFDRFVKTEDELPAIARMNLFLHGAENFHIERDDTLRLPAFYSGDSPATFDCVIANPPFSLKIWGDKDGGFYA